MSAAPSVEATLSDAQRKALVTLLCDEDTEVYHVARSLIIKSGPAASIWLKPHTLSNDPLLRRRSREIVQSMARHQADNEFTAFCVSNGENLDLETGSLMLARARYPDTNPEAYRALLDSYAAELAEEIEGLSGGVPILSRLNRYFFREKGFRGNEVDYYEPDNSYLNKVLDRKTGIPITLCAVYQFIARRLKLPVSGIALPHHFLCRYQTPTEEWFIDVFNGGKLLSKAECARHVAAGSPQGTTEGNWVPASSRRMLLRMVTNLDAIYMESGSKEESARCHRYIVALAR